MSSLLFKRMVMCPGFSIDMLMSILINEEREPKQQSLLFKRLLSYDFNEVDFFLPQLVCMLLNWPYSNVIYLLLYFEFRCAICSRFTYKLHWALQTFPNGDRIPGIFNHLGQHPTLFLKAHKQHRRRTVSDSDYPEVSFNGGSPRKNLKNQNDFVTTLTSIESSMIPLNSNHDLRARHLLQQLQDINKCLQSTLNVWNPLIDFQHRILHIPVQECNVLNSARRAPYILFMECVRESASKSRMRRKGRVDHLKCIEVPESDRHVKSDLSSCSTEVDLTESLFSDDSFVVVQGVDEADFLDEYDIVSFQEVLLSRIAIQSEAEGIILNPNLSPGMISSGGTVLNKPWNERIRNISEASEYINSVNRSDWFLSACIVKYCDDARHELLAYQFIRQLQRIWKLEKVSAYVCPVKTVLLSKTFAMMQVIPSAVSLHQIKCKFSGSLQSYMQHTYNCFLQAQENFVSSCAGYSIVCYLLQVKDRHNGNILLSSDGHLIHVDFGYILDSSPGSIGFEQAHFKITHEYVEVMGGVNSDMFKYYKVLMMQALIAARKHRESLLPLIRSYQKWTNLKCCASKTIAERMEKRFMPNAADYEVYKMIDAMVNSNLNALTTRFYDFYQYQSCGIR